MLEKIISQENPDSKFLGSISMDNFEINNDIGLNTWEMTQKYYPDLAEDNYLFISNMDRDYKEDKPLGLSSQGVKERKIEEKKEWGMTKALFIDSKQIKAVKVVVREDLQAWASNGVVQNSLMPVFAKFEKIVLDK